MQKKTRITFKELFGVQSAPDVKFSWAATRGILIKLVVESLMYY